MCQAFYEDRFARNLARYSGLRQRIQRKVEQILADPYDRTERLGRVSGGLDLRGCRSSRIDRNFRIIFVIYEECQSIKECQYCFCEDKEDKTVVFFDCRSTCSGLYYELRHDFSTYVQTYSLKVDWAKKEENANMPEFYKVAKVSEVPPGTKHLVEVDFVPVLLFNVDGEFYAMEDVCTHDGGPLGEGWFTGEEIECPRHGARFCVKTGKPLCMPAVEAVDCYTVKVEDDDILVSVD